MKAVTLRKIPAQVAQAVRMKAQAGHTSINRAVISMLEEATGTAGARGKNSHDDLDHLAGSWSREEGAAFDKVLAAQRSIDRSLWR